MPREGLFLWEVEDQEYIPHPCAHHVYCWSFVSDETKTISQILRSNFKVTLKFSYHYETCTEADVNNNLYFSVWEKVPETANHTTSSFIITHFGCAIWPIWEVEKITLKEHGCTYHKNMFCPNTIMSLEIWWIYISLLCVFPDVPSRAMSSRYLKIITMKVHPMLIFLMGSFLWKIRSFWELVGEAYILIMGSK